MKLLTDAHWEVLSGVQRSAMVGLAGQAEAEEGWQLIIEQKGSVEYCWAGRLERRRLETVGQAVF